MPIEALHAPGPRVTSSNSRLARELAVGLGHERGAAFLAAGHETDLRGVEQRVEDFEVALAGHAEGHVDTMGAQRRDDELAAAEKIGRHRPTSSLVSTWPFETMRCPDGRGLLYRDASRPDAI